MGQIKELWANEARLIERAMDEITAEYDEILNLYDYVDHLKDYFHTAHLEAFEAVIVEYHDELTFNYEQEKERHETKFKKAMEQGGLFFLDEIETCSPDVLVKLSKAAKHERG